MRFILPAFAICLIAVAARAHQTPVPVVVTASEPPPVVDAMIMGKGLPARLSDFGFFKDVSGKIPNDRVMPYELNSALFSDYAEKYRFIYLPKNEKAKADSERLIQFPVGSAIIKSFGYKIDGKDRLLETRVLLHRSDGWLALPYVWNEQQSEANLKVAGKRIPVTFTDPSGEKQTISYAVPNKNQCKECHSLGDVVMPIGPKLRNLTPESVKALIASNRTWGAFDGAAEMPDYDNQKAPLNLRARAYLDINCAHCHNRKGSASNSGLFLTYQEPVGPNLGIEKRPTAAGRGSGGLEFAIAPGKPDDSYMIYRLKSLDPGIAMPEVGRSTVHKEGVKLLSQWIAEME